MKTIKITTSDVRVCLGVGRSELQRWLTTLPPFSVETTVERKARQFKVKDLVFLHLVKTLIKSAGLSADTVSGFSLYLYEAVSAATVSARAADRRVTLVLNDNEQWTLDGGTSELAVLTLDVQPALSRVYTFLGLESQPEQRDLPLGLLVVESQQNRRAIK
jgi:hypothetical protein